MTSAPSGLDAFIGEDRKAPESGATAPDGLDDFISPEINEQKYGGLSGAAKSFGLGVARSASFGLSDEFLVNAGLINPENIKAYREQNPISSGGGEVAGIVGALLAPEGGALAELAGPVRAVSELGVGAAKGVKALAPATSTIGKILSQGSAFGIGSAVEGSFYGLGHAISEDALGDPDALGEKLMSHVGMGAITAGALGSLIGAGAVGIPAALENAGIKTEALRQAGENALIKASSLVSGKSVEDLQPLLKGVFTKEGAAVRKNAIEGFAEREKSAEKFASNLSEVNDSMAAAQKKYYQGSRTEEVTKLMERVPYDQSFDAAVDLSGKLKSVTKAMREEPEIYSSTGRVKKLENISEGLERRLSESKTSEDVYHAMNDAKGQIQWLTKWDGVPVSSEADTVNAIKSVGREFRIHLEDAAVYGEAGARQGALNSAYSDFVSAQKNMLQSFGRKLKSGEVKIDPAKVNSYFNQIGRPGAEIRQEIFDEYVKSASAFKDQMEASHANSVSHVDTNKLTELFNKTQAHASGAESELESVNQYKRLKTFGENSNVAGAVGIGAAAHMLGVPGAAISAAEAAYGIHSMLKHPSELVRVLSNVERAAMKVTNSINKGASGIFKVQEMIAPVRTYGALKFASRDEKQSDHDKMNHKLSDLNANPEKMLDMLHEKTLPVYLAAPNTAQGVQGTMLRATQFLQQKLPGNNIPKAPLSPKYKPSDSELSKWHKYFSIVENPTKALDQVASGTIVPETMETLSVVYPKMLQEMRMAVTDKLTETMGKEIAIPYRTKLALSLFLGSDMVNSLNPKSMLATQNMLATATMAHDAQEQGQMSGVNKKSLGKINKSNSLLTDSQSSAQRQEA